MIDIISTYDAAFMNDLLRLTNVEMQLFCLPIIDRQRELVQVFDRFYDEQLGLLFNESVSLGYQHILQHSLSAKEVESHLALLMEKIPDSEEFGHIEGSFGQTAMISIFYFFGFANQTTIPLILKIRLEWFWKPLIF